MPRSYNSVTAQSLHYFARPHDAVPIRPIESRAAWRGDTLSEQTDWQTTLDEADQEELKGALFTAKATGKAPRELTHTDFPLPSLGPRIAEWRRAVADGRGVFVIRGVPINAWSTEEAKIVFWALGQHLGVPGVQNREGDILGHVRDMGKSYDDPTVRGFKTSAQLAFHCDAADAVGLLCLKTAKAGGRSRFVSSVTVFNEILQRRPDLVPVLFEPFMLDTRGDGGLNFFPIPPCRFSEGRLRTFYHGDYFRSAQQHPKAPPLEARQLDLLDTYDSISNEPGLAMEIDFAPGDIQLLSNHTVLHGRSDYTDWDEPERKRHLLRLWLSFPTQRSMKARASEWRAAAQLVAALVKGRVRDRPSA